MHALATGAVVAVATIAIMSITTPSSAQSCGEDYVVVEGDTLAKIANDIYKQASQWTAIFNANREALSGDGASLPPGLKLHIPCIEEQAAAKPATASVAATKAPSTIVVSPTVKHIGFLTAGDLAPFTDRSLPNGGLITDIVSSAIDILKVEVGGELSYDVNWVNDWSAHLNPLLSTRAFDVGFPWVKPPCEEAHYLDDDSKYRCKKFFFSDPIFELVELLWVRKDSPIKFEADDEVLGKTYCRPRGHYLYHLDFKERHWLSDKRIELLQPQTVDQCFQMLIDGQIDGVFLSELTGRAAVVRLGLDEKIVGLPRPVDIRSLHAIVSKTHPNARSIFYYLNGALEKLRDDGAYDDIVEKHLALFWDTDVGDETKAGVTSETDPPAPDSEPKEVETALP